jgi:hypothetical protein
MELQRNKLSALQINLSTKSSIFRANSPEEYIKKLTVIWGAKGILKLETKISFKDHIRVKTFENIAKSNYYTSFWRKDFIYFLKK